MSDGLEYIASSAESGSTATGVVLALATVVLAPVGSYVGEGAGYVIGNVADVLPYVRDFAPWLLDRAGLEVLSPANLNEDFYQAVGGLTGFFVGAAAPWLVNFGLHID